MSLDLWCPDLVAGVGICGRVGVVGHGSNVAGCVDLCWEARWVRVRKGLVVAGRWWSGWRWWLQSGSEVGQWNSSGVRSGWWVSG